MRGLTRIIYLAAFAGLAGYLLVPGCRERTSHDNAVSGYIKVLKSDNAKDRQNAAEKLGKMKASDDDSVDALADATLDQNDGVQKAAAKALADIGNERAAVKLQDSLKKLQADGRSTDNVKKAYDDLVEDLQDKAMKGDEQAKKTLERLHESLEHRDHGVKIEIN